RQYVFIFNYPQGAVGLSAIALSPAPHFAIRAMGFLRSPPPRGKMSGGSSGAAASIPHAGE
ncbi:MAG TPA: hypothetical protein VK183_10080, partial [Flavobacterium sp.]|nr:hypothetical protein [Flavobacterium sp.]